MSKEPERPQWISTDTVRHPTNAFAIHDARQRERRLTVMGLWRSAGAITVLVAGRGVMVFGHSYSGRLVDGRMLYHDVTPDQAFEHVFGYTYKDLEAVLSLRIASHPPAFDTGEAAATDSEVPADE